MTAFTKHKRSPYKDPPTVDKINIAIHQQFNKICEKFGQPTIVIKSKDNKVDQKTKLKEKSKAGMRKKTSEDTLISPTISCEEANDDDYSTWLESSSSQLINDNSEFLNYDQLIKSSYFRTKKSAAPNYFKVKKRKQQLK